MVETGQKQGSMSRVMSELPIDPLKKSGQGLVDALVSRALGTVDTKVTALTGRLTEVAESGGTGLLSAITGKEEEENGEKGKGGLLSSITSGLSGGASKATETVKQAVGGGGGDGDGGDGGDTGGAGGSNAKVVNIIEQFDVGLPLRVAYDQWTQFQDFPTFTRKVESVDQESDEKVNWKAQIFWSHRSWEATITEQIPDTRIVWRSTGAKGSVDGAITFHELAPSMTRILMVLEYHPQGFFEKTANLWRAQGRRARADFKQIKRHMMTRTILEQDEIEGWRGEIRDSEVVQTHEDALEEERESSAQSEESEHGDYEDTGEEGYEEEGEGEEGEEDYEEEEDEEEEDEDRETEKPAQGRSRSQEKPRRGDRG
ncbi:SRPBCC family protein [Saccharopolyspora sp. MS10]|uniref:SRPBCC family protein n=1 Tax=Saccharopolyspora sp. MS10 TaxID=3385973 RepID=UPI0039A382AC